MIQAIDGAAVRDRRKAEGLTLDELARKAGIDRKTLFRIEKGEPKRGPRPETARKLAAALGCEADDLAARKQRSKNASSADEINVQINVRVSPDIRNFYSLLGKRYKLSITRMLEFAPIAIFILAEKSLEHRRLRLRELDNRMKNLSGMQDQFPEWFGAASPEPALPEIIYEELSSIERCDLFGEKVIDAASECFSIAKEWDFQSSNTFANYVREQLKLLDPEAELERLDNSILPPSYSLCRRDALNWVGSDEAAAEAILEGWVRLYEMPSELRRHDCPPDQRATWIREQLEKRPDPFDLDLDLPEEST